MKRGALLAVVVVAGFLFYFLNDDGPSRTRRASEGALSAKGHAGGAGGPEKSAQKQPSAEAEDDDPNRIDGPELVVRGIVTRHGRPVPGATVMLRRSLPADPRLQASWRDPAREDTFPPIVEAETGDDGRFLLRAPRRSRVTVTARAEGSAPASKRLFVPLRDDPAEVELELTEGFELRGIVVDAKGEPLSGARVRCVASQWQMYPLLEESVTGEDGRFLFEGLARGGQTLVVEMEGYPSYRRSVAVPEATEVELRLFPGGPLRGTVKDDRGRPLAGARLLVSFNARGDVLGARIDTVTAEDGSYEFAHAPATPVSYATVKHPDWGQRHSHQRHFRLPVGPVERWDIELAAGATVSGVVVDKLTGRPVPGARFTLLRLASGGRNFSESRHGETGAGGRFETRHVLEGTYVVRVEGARHARAVRSWVQPNEKLETDFFVDGVNDPPEVRIEVDRAGRVEGRILGDINASSNVQFMDNSAWARPDETGFFVFEAVPAGEGKKLRCWMPQCESEEFAVTEGGLTTVELKAEGKPQFSGVVVGANGDPVQGAYVKACPEANLKNEMRTILQQRGWNTVRTDAEGRFSLRVPEWQAKQSAATNWAIGAVSFAYPLQVKTGLRLPKEGDTRDVHFVLEEGGVIAGAVEFEGRGPIPNVRVTVSPKRGKDDGMDARQSRYTYTDLAGRFLVKGIGAGDWVVAATHADGKADAVTAVAGDQGIRIELKATLALAGVVLDDEDNPVVNARVGAVLGKDKFSWTNTDSSGRFRVAHLEPGDYPLEVTPQQQNQNYYGAQQAGGGFKKTRTRAYPAGSDDVVVRVEPGSRISGRVLGPGGKGIGGAGVMAVPKTKGLKMQPTAFTNGRGEFTLKGVEQGAYDVVVLASGYLIESTTASVGESGVEVRVREGGTIMGRLLKPGGTPLGGQWLSFQAADDEVRKKLHKWQSRGQQGWNAIGGWQRMSTSTNADGTFEITGLFPGRYKLSLMTQHGVAPDVELHTDGAATTIRLEPALTITGRIVTEDGSALEGQLWVSALRDSRTFGWTQPDSEGNFELKGLPSGAVTVQVYSNNVYQAARVDATAGDRNVRVVVKPRASSPKKKN